MNNKELFVKAFLEAEEKSTADYQNGSLFQWNFSETFEKKMDKLIDKDRRIKLQTRRKISRRLIAALIAAIIAFMGALTVFAAKGNLVEFIEKVRKKDIEITLSEYSSAPVTTIEKEYELHNIPEEYKKIEYQRENNSIMTIWQDENNSDNQIVFTQDLLTGSFSIDNEHDIEFLEINGQKAYLVNYKTGTHLMWTDSEYWFTLTVPQNLKNEILNMQKNIFEKN